MTRVFANITGAYALDKDLKIVGQESYTKAEDILKHAKKPGKDTFNKQEFSKISQQLYNKGILKQLRTANLLLTKQYIKHTVKQDTLLIQSINNIMETEKILNMLAKRLREWYGYYLPEFAKKIQDHQTFATLILKENKKRILQQLKLKDIDSMGWDLPEKDIKPMKAIAEQILTLTKFKQEQENYLTKFMEKEYPNMSAIATPLLAAKLIAKAGSMERLVTLPASTIQLLGAEKALFRHMATGARAPKYGLLIHHPLVTKVPQKNKGKMARIIANKLSIAIKVDYHKGKFVGKELNNMIEKTFKQLNKDKR